MTVFEQCLITSTSRKVTNHRKVRRLTVRVDLHRNVLKHSWIYIVNKPFVK